MMPNKIRIPDNPRKKNFFIACPKTYLKFEFNCVSCFDLVSTLPDTMNAVSAPHPDQEAGVPPSPPWGPHIAFSLAPHAPAH